MNRFHQTDVEESIRRTGILSWNRTLGIQLFLNASQIRMQVKLANDSNVLLVRSITTKFRWWQLAYNSIPSALPILSVRLQLLTNWLLMIMRSERRKIKYIGRILMMLPQRRQNDKDLGPSWVAHTGFSGRWILPSWTFHYETRCRRCALPASEIPSNCTSTLIPKGHVWQAEARSALSPTCQLNSI